MCASHFSGAGSSQLRTSIYKAAGWGRENAQLLGVMAGISAGVFWLGTYVAENKVLKQKLSDVEQLMAKDREVTEEKIKATEEKIKAAKADGAKEAAEKFLYGYAAEYEKYQKKFEGGAAKKNGDGGGSV